MRMMGRVLTVSLVMATMAACATQSQRASGAIEAAYTHPIFNPGRNAAADVDAAISAARTSGKHVMLVLGGDWCHDSIALSDLFHSPRFAAMLGQRYELVYAHVPRDTAERDPAIARRFGLDAIVGTPTVLILNPSGTAINLADAPRWRNAASRKPEAVYRHFARAVAPVED